MGKLAVFLSGHLPDGLLEEALNIYVSFHRMCLFKQVVLRVKLWHFCFFFDLQNVHLTVDLKAA